MFYVIYRQTNRTACVAETVELAVQWMMKRMPDMASARKIYRLANKRTGEKYGTAEYTKACQRTYHERDASGTLVACTEEIAKAKITFGKYEGWLIENVPTRALYWRQDSITKALNKCRKPEWIEDLNNEYQAIEDELESRPEHHRADTSADDRRIDDAEEEVFVPSMEGDKLRKLPMERL